MNPAIVALFDRRTAESHRLAAGAPPVTPEEGAAYQFLVLTHMGVLSFLRGLVEQGRTQDALDLIDLAVRLPFGTTPVRLPWEPPS